MGGRSYDVRILDRVLEQTCGDEAGGVSHINHKDGANLVCDGTHTLPIPFAGVCRSASDEELGLALESDLLHLVVIDHSGLFVEMVCHRVVVDTGHIHGRAVGEVTAVSEVEAHKGVTGLEAGHEYCHIGLGAGVGLHIRILGIEEFLEAVDSKLFDLVDDLAAAVIPCARITLCILVGANAAKSLEHLFADKILGSDELDTFGLTLFLFPQQVGNFNILFH